MKYIIALIFSIYFRTNNLGQDSTFNNIVLSLFYGLKISPFETIANLAGGMLPVILIWIGVKWLIKRFRSQKSSPLNVTVEQSIPINEVIQTEKHESANQSPPLKAQNIPKSLTATENFIKYGPWVFSAACIIALSLNIFQLDRDSKKTNVINAPTTSPAAIATQKPIEAVAPQTSTNADEFATLKKDINPLNPNHPDNYFSIKNIETTPLDKRRSRYEYWMQVYAPEFLTKTGIEQFKELASNQYEDGFGLTECIEYWAISGASTDSDFYIDRCTIKSLGNYRTMWTLTSNKLPQKSVNGKYYLSFKSRAVYDCTNERTATIGIFDFDKAMGVGNVVDSLSFKESEWKFQDVRPNSIGADELRKACQNFNLSKSK